jgi:UPF0755 protein
LKKRIWIGIPIAVLILICAGLILDFVQFTAQPVGSRSEKKIVTVQKGQSFSRTATLLHQSGLIRNPFKFRLLARINGADTRIQAGEYLLSGDMSPREILDTMVSGKVRLYKVTVPEGYNLNQIASIYADAGFVDPQTFMAAATDADLLRREGIPADSFEGYLFPDTYYFPRKTDAEDIIVTMTERLRSLLRDEWKKRSEELGLSLHEVLTLASIIEKETGAAFERPLISSVFHNRLQKGMRLQTDPTVIYGIEDFDGNLTRKHLQTPTPYNTYKIRGLPPGPIASPGLSSIEAALYPADTKYLYFVSKKDRTHYFSTNLYDHRRAIRKYQLRR